MDFSREIASRGAKEHRTIRQSAVTLVGVGALGGWTAQVLGASGIGKATIIDRDIVDASNVPHQPLFGREDIGLPKAQRAALELRRRYPGTRWIAKDIDLDADSIRSVKGPIIDCTDNLSTRYLINEYCVKNKIAWVHGAAIADRGEAAAFLPGQACYRCLLPSGQSEESCATSGILASNASLVASIQARLALDLICAKMPATGLWRLREGTATLLSFKKNPSCQVCAKHEYSHLGKKADIISLCGTGIYQLRAGKAAAKSQEAHAQATFPGGYRLGPLTVFLDGRILIKAPSAQRAKALLSRHLPT